MALSMLKQEKNIKKQQALWPVASVKYFFNY
jgi:hypothetical protein